MSQDLGYINARLKGAHAHFLKEKDFGELFNCSSLEQFFSSLLKTPYGEFIQGKDLESLDEALTAHWKASLSKIQSFCEGPILLALNVYLWRIDLENLKLLAVSLLKGTERPSFTPITGYLTPRHLDELSRLSSLQDIGIALLSWEHPLANLFLDLPADIANSKILELYLEKKFFFFLDKILRGFSQIKRTISQYWRARIDFLNIRGALILKEVKERIKKEEFFIPGGKDISLKIFLLLANPELSAKTCQKLAREEDWRFLKAIKSVEDLELLYPQKKAENAKRRYRADPLGAGVLLAFLEEKELEILNLRLIARSIYYGFPREEAKANLAV